VSEGSGYRNIALAAIGETVAPELLASKSAIVLERIARGGGATSWYLVRAPGDLDALVERLKPGSSVSFYFDDRLSVGPFDDEALASLLAIIERDGDAVIGAVRDDEMEIKVDFPGGGRRVRRGSPRRDPHARKLPRPRQRRQPSRHPHTARS
jgi:hypothetical protein